MVATGASSSPVKKKKRLPKHRRRNKSNNKNKEKGDKVDADENKPASGNRDSVYAVDVKEYLKSWREYRDYLESIDSDSATKTSIPVKWKFKKNLQSWALDNCFNKEKIDSELFKELLPYILTIKGESLFRLWDTAKNICSGNHQEGDDQDKDNDKDDNKESQSEEKNEPKVKKSTIARARAIDQLISKIQN